MYCVYFALLKSSSHAHLAPRVLNNNEWIVDTGATDHMTPFYDILVNAKKLHVPVMNPQTRSVVAIGRGVGGLYKLQGQKHRDLSQKKTCCSSSVEDKESLGQLGPT
ncbi:hypothetical protein V2J09_018179 [Rumex salicifolius]